MVAENQNINCAISEFKKISSNYLMNNKNNININQSNDNIKMVSKNQNNNCVISELKNNLSTNYIMDKNRSNRFNRNDNTARSKAPIKIKPSKKYIRKDNKEYIEKLLNGVIEKKINKYYINEKLNKLINEKVKKYNTI